LDSSQNNGTKTQKQKLKLLFIHFVEIKYTSDEKKTKMSAKDKLKNSYNVEPEEL
jgi:hypothetical protein